MRGAGVILIVLCFVFALPLAGILFYDGERTVNGTKVDCVSLFDDGQPLPPGYEWKISANPLLPGALIWWPVGLIVTGLTDGRCPEPVQVIPGAGTEVRSERNVQ